MHLDAVIGDTREHGILRRLPKLLAQTPAGWTGEGPSGDRKQAAENPEEAQKRPSREDKFSNPMLQSHHAFEIGYFSTNC